MALQLEGDPSTLRFEEQRRHRCPAAIAEALQIYTTFEVAEKITGKGSFSVSSRNALLITDSRSYDIIRILASSSISRPVPSEEAKKRRSEEVKK